MSIIKTLGRHIAYTEIRLHPYTYRKFVSLYFLYYNLVYLGWGCFHLYI